jgi:hypothetical protein
VAAWRLKRCGCSPTRVRRRVSRSIYRAKNFAAHGAVAGGQAGDGAAAVFPVAAAAEFLVGDGSPVPSGRNFINRSGGRVPYSHLCGADSKTHYCGLCRIYRPCEILTGIFIATLCRVFRPAAHSVRVGTEQTILRHGFCRATSFQKEVSVL